MNSLTDDSVNDQPVGEAAPRDAPHEPTTFGVAVVGLGVGEQHVLAYSRLPGCRIERLYDRDPARTAAVIGRLGVGTPAESFQAILDDPTIHIVSIATYDDMHFDALRSALLAGKHVFVEKPMCRTVAELRAVKESWGGSGHPKLVSNLVLRAAPVYVWLQRRIEEGGLGRVYAFDGDYLFGRLHKITEGWRSHVMNYSVMAGGGIHLVDLMLRLVGERPQRVATVGNRICTEGTAFRYDEFMASTFSFPSGVIGRVTANFGCVHRHQHVVRVFGTEATFVSDDTGPRLCRSRAETDASDPIDLSTLPAGKGDLIPEFFEAIAAGADIAGATQREFDVISVCAAADEALATGQPVEIEYV